MSDIINGHLSPPFFITASLITYLKSSLSSSFPFFMKKTHTTELHVLAFYKDFGHVRIICNASFFKYQLVKLKENNNLLIL